MSLTKTGWLCCVLLLVVVAAAGAFRLEVLQGPVYRIPADTDSLLTVRFMHNSSNADEMRELERIRKMDGRMIVTPRTEFDWQLTFKNESISFDWEEIKNSNNKSFVFSSYYWGYVPLEIYGSIATDATTQTTPGKSGDDAQVEVHTITAPMILNNDTMVIVDRKDSSKTLDTVFLVLATSFMLINTINMGCQLDLKVIFAVLKKPVGPAVGVFSQFICMPLFSFMTGWLLLDNPLHRLGLFTLGCSPGGSASNFWTLLFDGDLNLSITMTFISTIIAMVMMPLWMVTLGSKLMGEDSTITIPYGNLALSLLALTVPIVIGLVIKYKKKSWAKKSEKIVKPMTFCMLMFFLTVGVYNSYKSLALMTWELVLAGFMVSFGGYTAGALLSFACRLKRKQIIAISIETAFQNAAIAFLLLKLSLPTPDSDLAAVPVLAQLFQTGPPLLTLYLVWQCFQKAGYCILNKENDKNEDESCESNELKKPLNETPSDEAPRTPGLLFDPSKPEDLKQSCEKLPF